MNEAFLEPILRFLRIRRILRRIPPGSAVCDIGCGMQGSFLRSISSHIASGVGLDKKVSPYQDGKITLRRSHLGDRLDLPSQTFDCVTLLAVLEHLAQPEEILEEAYRILKPGGVLLLTTPTPLSQPLLEFLAFKLRLISQEEISDHKRYFSGKEIQSILHGIGYQAVELSTFQFKLNNFAAARK